MTVGRAAIRLPRPLRIGRRGTRRVSVRGLRGPLPRASRRVRGRRVPRGVVIALTAARRGPAPLRIRRGRERVRRLLPPRGIGRGRFAVSAAAGVPDCGAGSHARGSTRAGAHPVAVAGTGADAGGAERRGREGAGRLAICWFPGVVGGSGLCSGRQRGEGAEREAEESGCHFHFLVCVEG